ncbi:MAG: UDP-N-acetylmuramoyl-tripeptide-D-alanyl-D-alanine ligase [Candidatus Nomurabacteria bacterium GW2011_GWB1_37_5]|uniref:UDP-N-acetylmuramoyl-tripeptide-D-alanyl-D-alanine ligase n=1 Tax=Candidatus Nomurabacteria bacterium GW2011_GWB1_37_5 TaxID=1618742 RepID=A0A0G0GWK3_9BACT|nr:MAG: UDP-N-acetylmuramoyl-tripeptide-D-alanyl-D-alanine ligase [Candidatus Nomurabacteria bacterium GW2011_GWB1_37_5]
MKSFIRKIIISLLRIEAKLVLKKYKPKIVAITGNVGKTSTKEAVFAVLSKSFSVRKNVTGFGPEADCIFAILGCEPIKINLYFWMKCLIEGLELLIFNDIYPKWLILEIAVRMPGDLDELVGWLKTDRVIATRFGQVPSHIEFFKSSEDLINEKAKLLNTLRNDGMLILNCDDSDAYKFSERSAKQALYFGFNDDAVFKASNANISYIEDSEYGHIPNGLIFRVDYSGNSVPVLIEGSLGMNHVYSGLASLALASSLDLNIISSIEALKSYNMPPGRMRLIRGEKQTMIIDDSYNSSPLACEEAIRTLKEVETPKSSGRGRSSLEPEVRPRGDDFGVENNSSLEEERSDGRGPTSRSSSTDATTTGGPFDLKEMKRRGIKIAVLGDMLELGRHTESSHLEIGRLAAKVADIIVSVGIRARWIADGALAADFSEKNIFHFNDSHEAGLFVEKMIQKGDLILIKGSQAVRMEKIVLEIMAEPDRAPQLLVRQD